MVNNVIKFLKKYYITVRIEKKVLMPSSVRILFWESDNPQHTRSCSNYEKQLFDKYLYVLYAEIKYGTDNKNTII